MSVADDLLDRFLAVGARVEATDSRLLVRAGAQPVPAELVQRLRDAKTEVLATLAPAWWRRQFVVRTITRELGGLRPRSKAQWLAWGELECRWHRLYGEHVAECQCAGCGRPIGGVPSLDLQDGNRVHLDQLDCIIRYGERWRGAATLGLAAMGLKPPKDDP